MATQYARLFIPESRKTVYLWHDAHTMRQETTGPETFYVAGDGTYANAVANIDPAPVELSYDTPEQCQMIYDTVRNYYVTKCAARVQGEG